MIRHRIAPRPDWRRKVEALGFLYHGGEPGEDPYWDEGVAYEFTADEVDLIEAASAELHRLCLDAVDHIVSHPDLMERFAIPPAWRAYVARSWERRDPHVLGRFDLAYDPANPLLAAPKMLEYNADTPTTLIETAVVQWFWLEECRPGCDQFNSLHERLIERWRSLASRMGGAKLHLSALSDSVEERQTVAYLQDVAHQAGLATALVPVEQVGWRAADRSFVDLDETPIRFWYKLYPWEWVATDAFGAHLLEDRVGVVEPAWKMLLSNKAILPVLWSLFPGHPNLLPASFAPGEVGDRWIAKPILAREGANLTMRLGEDRAPVVTGGSYGGQPVVYQQAVELAAFDGCRVVLGSWMAGDTACGMILREADGPIVGTGARVVPHFFRP